MISVIVPVYNVEQYLDACVESIINQTYKDLEIILIDDGSPDSCPKMCDEWAKKDSRIKVVHKKNGGLSSARNTGLDIATGEYIAFVDSDDSIDVNMYKTMVDLFCENVDMVICGYQKVLDKKEIIPCDINNYKLTKLNSLELCNEIFGNLNNAVWNKIYRKSLVDEIYFPEGIVHGEDLIFNLDCLKKSCGGLMIDCKFYHYYSRENSITKSKFNQRKLFEIKSKDIAKNLVEKHFPEQIKNAQKYCFRARMNVIRSIYLAGKENEQKKIIKEINLYIKSHFSQIKTSLKLKEIIEYYLYIYLKPLYKFIIKLK